MKRLFLIGATTAIILSLLSCDHLIDKDPVGPSQIVFKVSVSQEVETKSIKRGFQSGDVIYIFFNNVAICDPPKYATLTFDGNKWTGALQGGLAISELVASGATLRAVYYPFGTVKINTSGSYYMITGSDGTPIYTYYLQTLSDVGYTVDIDGSIATLTASLSMQFPTNFVHFFIDNYSGAYAENIYRLSVQGVRPRACYCYNTNGETGNLIGTDLDAGQPMWGYPYDGGIVFSGDLDEAWESGTEHRIVYFEPGVAAKTKVFDKKLTARSAIKLSNVSSWQTAVTIPSSVDIGIYKNNNPATGIKLEWATMNLGAGTSYSGSGIYTDYGMYFAWGELVPYHYTDASWRLKTDFSIDTYNNVLIGAYPINKKRNLIPIYDTAYSYLGEGWRMPTSTELNALLSLTNELDEESRCLKVTNNGNSLYFPTSGYRNQQDGPWGGDYGTIYAADSWASTDEYLRNYCLSYSFIDSVNPIYVGGTLRYHGGNIRPVREVAE